MRACAALAPCNPVFDPHADPDVKSAVKQNPNGFFEAIVQGCIDSVIWSAERAIPLQHGDALFGLGFNDERPEYFVACALARQGDCAAVNACLTNRTAPYQCQEDGCRQGAPAASGCGSSDCDTVDTSIQIRCEGDVATFTGPTGATKRDCSKAYLRCDAASPTGCNDRPFARCGERLTHDVCDGNVKIGCDAEGFVSYHDCARMGGTCGRSGDSVACLYKSDCDPNEDTGTCAAGRDTECVNGSSQSAEVAGFCAQPSSR